ncbi:MAG: hypothetical protein M9955_12790 [Rhizobiaceae bacterium]|nr:hypothetical protein [Rhizobiaceae bacterium]
MGYVATEICDETGSWLTDFAIDYQLVKANEGDIIFLSSEDEKQRYGLDNYPIENKRVLIRKLSMIEQSVSYMVHTNRELILMLQGRKPFAVFFSIRGENYNVFNGQNFYKYKKLIKYKKVQIEDKIYHFKYLEKEYWRISAFILVEKIRSYLGNSVSLEAAEGELLGYSREENIQFINNFYMRYVVQQGN